MFGVVRNFGSLNLMLCALSHCKTEMGCITLEQYFGV
jgi:hypothetical protein